MICKFCGLTSTRLVIVLVEHFVRVVTAFVLGYGILGVSYKSAISC